MLFTNQDCSEACQMWEFFLNKGAHQQIPITLSDVLMERCRLLKWPFTESTNCNGRMRQMTGILHSSCVNDQLLVLFMKVKPTLLVCRIGLKSHSHSIHAICLSVSRPSWSEGPRVHQFQARSQGPPSVSLRNPHDHATSRLTTQSILQTDPQTASGIISSVSVSCDALCLWQEHEALPLPIESFGEKHMRTSGAWKSQSRDWLIDWLTILMNHSQNDPSGNLHFGALLRN
jgi:hypothetical protein